MDDSLERRYVVAKSDAEELEYLRSVVDRIKGNPDALAAVRHALNSESLTPEEREALKTHRPRTRRPPRDSGDYQRGYQAGYHAAVRARALTQTGGKE